MIQALCQIYVLCFPPLSGLSYHFLMLSFEEQKFFCKLKFISYLHFMVFVQFMSYCNSVLTKFFCYNFRNSIVLALIFTSVIHYELIF